MPRAGGGAVRQDSLAYRGPLAREPLVNALAAHAVPGLERVTRGSDGAAVERLLTLPSGPVEIAVRFRSDGEVVLARPQLPDTEDAELTARVRSWLDLEADHTVIDPFLSRFDLLEPLVRCHPGLRVPGTTDGFETAVLTVLGQQVSLAAARTFGARLVASFGRPGPAGLSAFPTPESLAAVPAEDIQAAVRIPHARARTVSAMARAAVEGLALHPSADRHTARRELLALPGIGPWTADYLAVRVLGDRDAYPADDLVLKRALGVGTGREAALLSQPWRPWRSYALFHLWTAAAYAPIGKAAVGKAAG
ncbi:hypothetical protein LJ756_07160 [Arthrobacter sp. zg-Y411]|nr:hypothetical protein [Arthrobacter zhangbolii]